MKKLLMLARSTWFHKISRFINGLIELTKKLKNTLKYSSREQRIAITQVFLQGNLQNIMWNIPPRELKQNKAFLVFNKYLQLCTTTLKMNPPTDWNFHTFLFTLFFEEKWLQDIKKEISAFLLFLLLLNLNKICMNENISSYFFYGQTTKFLL